jgi:hypothetical protein
MSCVSSGAGQVYYKREFAGTDLEVRGEWYRNVDV